MSLKRAYWHPIVEENHSKLVWYLEFCDTPNSRGDGGDVDGVGRVPNDSGPGFSKRQFSPNMPAKGV